MRICMISREFPWREPFGGVGVYTADAARALAIAGQEVTVVTQSPDRSRRKDEISGVRVLGVPFHPYPVLPRRLAEFSGLNSAAWARAVGACLDRSFAVGPDIVEAPAMSGEALHLQRRHKRPPVVIRIHGGTSLYLKNLGCFRWYHKPLYRRERTSVTLADRLAVVSGQARQENELHYGVKMDSAAVIPNPIDTEFLKPMKKRDRGGELRVLFVGRLDAGKGFDRMPDIIERVLRDAPASRFTFAGAKDGIISRTIPDNAEDYLRARLTPAQRDRVALLGSVPLEEMAAIYRENDVLAAPSRSESWSRACAEAAACGIPAVGARGTGIESIIVDGETGYLEPVSEPARFADRIIELARDSKLRHTMGRAARVRAESLFGFDTVAKQLIDLYRQTIDDAQTCSHAAPVARRSP